MPHVGTVNYDVRFFLKLLYVNFTHIYMHAEPERVISPEQAWTHRA